MQVACCGCGGGIADAVVSCITPHSLWTDTPVDCIGAGRARLSTFDSTTACASTP
jgi:hypothetical protein